MSILPWQFDKKIEYFNRHPPVTWAYNIQNSYRDQQPNEQRKRKLLSFALALPLTNFKIGQKRSSRSIFFYVVKCNY